MVGGSLAGGGRVAAPPNLYTPGWDLDSHGDHLVRCPVRRLRPVFATSGVIVAALPMAAITSASHIAFSAVSSARPSVARTPAQDTPRKPATDTSTALNRSVPACAQVTAAQ